MAAYWKGQHKQAILREEILKKTIEEQKAKIRDLNKRLFGKNEGSLETATRRIEQDQFTLTRNAMMSADNCDKL